jgi:hypothetical protein
LARDTLSRLTALRSPYLIRLLDLVDGDGRGPWLLSEHLQGVSLQRLLIVATLTPVQAAFVASQVLAGVARLHDAGVAHGRLSAETVLVDIDGEIRLADWALTSLALARSFDEVRGGDLADARALVSDLAHNANRPVVRHRGRENALLTSLEQYGNGGAATAIGASAQELRRALVTAADDGTGPNIRAELAALVTTLTKRVAAVANGSAPSEAGWLRSSQEEPARTSWRRPVRVTPMLPARPLSQANWHHTRRRSWPAWVAAGLTIAVLVVAGYLFAHESVSAFANRMLHHHAAATKSDSPKPATGPAKPAKAGPSRGAATTIRTAPPPVPSLAPGSAGSISGVDLRPLAICTPATSCPVRVTVRFASAYTGEQVVWRIALINRCTGATTTVPARTVTGDSGFSYVYDTASVKLPAARSLAVIAVTEAPARAASPALLLPAGGGSC